MTKDVMKEFRERIKYLAEQGVLVGIPEEKTSRTPEPGEKAGITNAAVGYLAEHGSPAQNIPQRAFLVPGVQDASSKAANYLGQAGRLALSGDRGSADKAFHAAGLVSASSVKAKISSGPFKKLADATLAARRRRGRTGTKPLQDTDQLLNSVTYVMRKTRKK